MGNEIITGRPGEPFVWLGAMPVRRTGVYGTTEAGGGVVVQSPAGRPVEMVTLSFVASCRAQAARN